MRFKINIPKRGDTRIKSKFLWFPKWISEEIRWLEYVTWEDFYVADSGTWYARNWIDEDEK